jgi:hypothetical protein
MIDQPGRSSPRFPDRLSESVKVSIKRWLQENNVRIGFSSAACGADILFQEAVAELSGETRVVLPCQDEQFVQDSVAILPDGDWVQRFHDVVKKATQVVYASDGKIETGAVSYDYANLFLQGMATVRACELETELVGLAVWDGRQGDGPGGTASVVDRWKIWDVPAYHLDLSVLPKQNEVSFPVALDKSKPQDLLGGSKRAEGHTRIMAMLFADAVNFSKLTERQVPLFVEHFVGGIAGMLKDYNEDRNPIRNTWGDGLYLVFSSVGDAGLFALVLRDMIVKTKWSDKELPPELSLRIALHVGPVYGCTDPVTC